MKNQKNLSHKVIWAIIFGEHLFLSDKKSCLEDNTAYFGSNIIIGRSNPQLSRDEHILLHHFESGYTCWRTIILKWKLEMNLSVELSAIVNSERSTCQSFSESKCSSNAEFGKITDLWCKYRDHLNWSLIFECKDHFNWSPKMILI